MRVSVITQYFWPENFRINDLATGLRERGHEVTVYTGKPNYPEGRFFPGYGFFGRIREDYHGVRVIRAPLIPRGSGGRFRLVLNFFSFALFGSLLAPFRCHGTYDVILVYEPSPVTVGLPALVLKWIKRAPMLFWVQDLWPETLSATGLVHSSLILRAVGQLVRFIYRHCDLILVQSRAFMAPVEALGVAAQKILYYPNSAEEVYRPLAIEPSRPSGPQSLPGGFRVVFAGNIGAAQLLVIPSRREAMSIFVLEAGICGTPVLITDQCGFNEVEAIGGGTVVAASADALLLGLRSLLKDTDALRSMGLKLKDYVTLHLLWGSMARKYLELFDRVIEAQR